MPARRGHPILHVIQLTRVHQTLRVTPAMEAGLTDHAWSIEEIVALVEDLMTKKVLLSLAAFGLFRLGRVLNMWPAGWVAAWILVAAWIGTILAPYSLSD